MVGTLYANWNGVVSSDDTVYVLGDFAMNRGHEGEVTETFEALHGRKRLLRGNRDKRFVSRGVDSLHQSSKIVGTSVE